jgi:hypothetical protein
LALAALLAIGASTVGWAQDANSVKVADVVEVTATVDAIDLAQRLVTVHGPWKDRAVTVKVGSDVPGLETLKVGDRVAITHHAAIVAQMKKPGTAARAAKKKTAPTPTSGDRTVVVVVDSVDQAENTVSFTRDGKKRTAVIEDPDARKFIKKLKKGDEVELVYTEAFATSLKRVP